MLNNKFLLLTLVLFFSVTFLSGMVSADKVITFTKPPVQVTDLNGTLVSGGELVANTTYFYTVVAVVDSGYYQNYGGYSGMGNEINFTTTDTHKKINLNWSVSAEAGNYLVFRRETGEDYGLNKRFYCVDSSTASHIGTNRYPTTEQNYFVDNGTISRAYYVTHSVTPIGTPFPYDLDPRTYGVGRLVFTGGTDEDPITFQDIYDDAVTNNWTDWCYWDKTNFALLGGFYIVTSTETHFLHKTGSFTNLGATYIHANAEDSKIQFGEKSSTGQTTSPVTYYMLGSNYNQAYIREGSYFYNVNVVSLNRVGSPYFNNFNRYYSSTFSHIYDMGEFKDVKFTNQISNYNDFVMSGITIETYFYQLLQTYWMSDLTMNYVSFYGSSECERLDTIKCYSSSYQLQSPRTLQAHVIDGDFPNTQDVDKLPICYWSGSTEEMRLASFVNLYYSLKLKIIDENNNAINNANITIKDGTNGFAKDFSGENISILTDNEGYVWLERINITSVSNDTLSDNSKSWVTNEWKGRNVYIVNGGGMKQKMKIKINNETSLILTENFVTDPSVDDLAGIFLELYTANLSYKAGSGDHNPYGSDQYTNKDIKSPFTFTITHPDYHSKEFSFNITGKIDWIVSLEEKPSWNYSVPPLFLVKNKSTTGVFKISSEGNLAIAGNLYENTNSPPTETIVWQIGDLIYLTKSGNLYIKGVEVW